MDRWRKLRSRLRVALVAALVLAIACCDGTPPVTPRQSPLAPATRPAVAVTRPTITSPALTRPAATAPVLPPAWTHVAPKPLRVPAAEGAPEKTFAWQAIFRGVDYVHAHVDDPRPMNIHIARIDVTAPGLRFLVTPESTRQKGCADTLIPSGFLSKHKLQIAVNGSPFISDAQQEGVPRRIRGLSVSNGNVYSSHESIWGAVVITRDNRVRITMPPIDLTGAWNGLAGYSLPLQDGASQAGDARQLHPRTAVGVSQDGRYFFMIVIDGRQPRVSQGATLHDIAVWLRRAGAWTALNLDGGASATMVMRGPDGKPKVLNKPMHLGTPGLERPSANHIGVYAEPLN